MGTIKVKFINNIGGGFADILEVTAGTTLEQFVRDRIDSPTRSYQIRVNSEVEAGVYVLQPDDRIVVQPTKIAGACIA